MSEINKTNQNNTVNTVKDPVLIGVYYHALDEDNKDCLIVKTGNDEYEIIHECLSGMIISNYIGIGAKEAGFKTIRINGFKVAAKEHTIKRFLAKTRQRLLKFNMFNFDKKAS